MPPKISLPTLALVLLIACHVTLASRILLVPFPYTSHTYMQAAIGRALVARGHEVHILMAEGYPGLGGLRKDLNVITFRTKYPDIFSVEDGEDYWMENILELGIIHDMRYNTKGFIEFCHNALEDDQTMAALKELAFDIVLVDATYISRCYLLIPFKLGLPYIGVTSFYEPWLLRNPALPSTTPISVAGNVSDEMTLLERVRNLWVYLDWVVWPRLVFSDDALIAKYVPGADSHVTFNWLAGQSRYWLIDTDFLIDYARPLMPNEVLVGGLITRDANPLPSEFTNFITPANSSTQQKVVLISFGTTDAQKAAAGSVDKFLAAFAKLPDYKIVWRSTDKNLPNIVSENVLVREWIPQNDLLGHPATSLLIYHCGSNSQFEALYHGVPHICFPVFGDQPYNAERARRKGLGLTFDLRTFTAEGLASAIVHLTTDGGVGERVKRASLIFRSRKDTPSVRAAEAVENAINFQGMQHLQSHALQMPWYSFLMLDIYFLFVFAPTVLTSFACAYCCLSRKSVPGGREPLLGGKKIN